MLADYLAAGGAMGPGCGEAAHDGDCMCDLGEESMVPGNGEEVGEAVAATAAARPQGAPSKPTRRSGSDDEERGVGGRRGSGVARSLEGVIGLA